MTASRALSLARLALPGKSAPGANKKRLSQSIIASFEKASLQTKKAPTSKNLGPPPFGLFGCWPGLRLLQKPPTLSTRHVKQKGLKGILLEALVHEFHLERHPQGLGFDSLGLTRAYGGFTEKLGLPHP